MFRISDHCDINSKKSNGKSNIKSIIMSKNKGRIVISTNNSYKFIFSTRKKLLKQNIIRQKINHFKLKILLKSIIFLNRLVNLYGLNF